jgi:hypothetical protein
MIKNLFIFLCAAALILSGSFFSTAEAQLTAPTLSATAVSNGQINLSWTDDNNGVYGYVIDRSLNPSSGFVTIADVGRKATSYNNVGLNSGTTYYYRITGYKQNESSPYSNIASATTQAGASVPNTPSNLSASAMSSSQIYLTWHDNSSNETGFQIQRATSSGGPWAQIATVGANTSSYSNTGLSASTTYYYRVLAYNSSGNSSYSNTANATTQSGGSATIPLAPSNLTATAVSSSQINLAWHDNSSNETGFQIWRYDASAGWSQIANVGANTSSYSNTGLSSSTTYYYYVLAYNSAGNSSYSNTASATTQSGGSITVPNAPSNLSATAVSSSQINLAWNDNSNNETSFEIWIYQSGIGWNTLPFQNANVTSYTDEGLSPSTLYYYVVRAVNSAGVSRWSNAASASTLSGPGSGDTTPPSVSIASPPSGSTYTASQTVTIYATASDNVGVTKVEFYDNGVLKGTDTTNAYTYAWTFAASNNGTHSWTAKAYDAAGNVKISTAVSLTVNIPVADTTPPTVPTLTASAVSCSRVNLSWTASTDSGGSGFKGYRVYRGGAYIKQVLAPSTSTSDTNLSASTNYSYRVSAIDNAGNESAQSNAAVTSTPACADTIAPTVSITSPAPGTTYTTAQTVTITANASDNVSVARVEFYDGTTLKATDTSYPYTYAWAFTSANNGTHSWTAKAYDAAGNSASSSAVSLTVNIGVSSGGDTLWAKGFGGSSGQDYGETVAVDKYDNSIVMAGVISGPVDLGGGPLNDGDIFIAKYSASGTRLWSKSFATTGSKLTVEKIAVDNAGNVVLTGTFEGTVNFGGGPLTSTFNYYKYHDMFMVKFSPSGAFLWSKSFGGAGWETPYDLTIDSNDNIIIVGGFSGGMTLGGESLISYAADTFVAKFTSTGNHIWSTNFESTSTDLGSGVTTDISGNVVVVGSFGGTVDFGGGPLTSSVVDMYVVKLSSAAGQYMWVRNFRIGDAYFDGRIVSDNEDNLIVSGYFQGTANFGGNNFTSAGEGDIFVAKYSATGGHMWSKAFGDMEWQIPYDISVDSLNNVVITGYFLGTVDFGGQYLTSGGGYSDIFVAKYTGYGNLLWANDYGRDDSPEGGRGVAVDSNDNVVITGFLYNPVDFGTGLVETAGNGDILLLKLAP